MSTPHNELIKSKLVSRTIGLPRTTQCAVGTGSMHTLYQPLLDMVKIGAIFDHSTMTVLGNPSLRK